MWTSTTTPSLSFSLHAIFAIPMENNAKATLNKYLWNVGSRYGYINGSIYNGARSKLAPGGAHWPPFCDCNYLRLKPLQCNASTWWVIIFHTHAFKAHTHTHIVTLCENKPHFIFHYEKPFFRLAQRQRTPWSNKTKAGNGKNQKKERENTKKK